MDSGSECMDEEQETRETPDEDHSPRPSSRKRKAPASESAGESGEEDVSFVSVVGCKCVLGFSDYVFTTLNISEN